MIESKKTDKRRRRAADNTHTHARARVHVMVMACTPPPGAGLHKGGGGGGAALVDTPWHTLHKEIQAVYNPHDRKRRSAYYTLII